jgi:hypothetical protein
MQEFRIVVERRVMKRGPGDKILAQLDRFASLALKGERGRGWRYAIDKIKKPLRDGDNGLWIYTQTVFFTPTSNRETIAKKWPRIVQRFARAACAGSLRGVPWKVVQPEGYTDLPAHAQDHHGKTGNLHKRADEPKILGHVNLEPDAHFSRIYGREPQINRIFDALKLASRTDWVKRTHTLLDGEPGCGKSEIMKAFANMLGCENEAWRWFDATSMTKAGAIEEIMKSPVVPPVLFIEEIEKCEEAALRWLLGVMDTRGEIRRTNYRVGNQARNVRMVVIATANDVKLLQQVLSSALYSRFQNRIYCPPPDRAIMERILTREMRDIYGRKEWVEPALEFAFDKWGMRDPRSIIAIFSCGGDRLLDGSFQRDYEATMHPHEMQKLLSTKEACQNGRSTSR